MNARLNRPDEQDKLNHLIGSNLQYIRKLKGFTLKKLAEKLSVKFQQVQKYESGKNQMCAFRLWKTAQVLEVPINAFFDEHFIAKNKAFYEAKYFGDGEVKGKDFQNALADQFEEQFQRDETLDRLKGRL